MRINTRDRINRLLLAAFLNSDLSAKEIQELSDEMASSPNFLWEFNTLLRDVIDRLKRGEPEKQTSSEQEPWAPYDLAYAAIQRRRLSKKEVLTMMSIVAPELKRQIYSKEISVREMLKTFFSTVSMNQAEHFLSIVGARPDEDAYLQGIIRRR